MAVEVLARPVVAHRGPRISLPGCDLNVTRVDTGVEHGGDEGVTVHPRQPDASICRKVPQPPRCSVPIPPCSPAVEQQWAYRPLLRRAVDSPADRGRQRDQDDVAPVAEHPQDPVAVLLAEIVDIGADGLEDPQAEQSEQTHLDGQDELSAYGATEQQRDGFLCRLQRDDAVEGRCHLTGVDEAREHREVGRVLPADERPEALAHER